MMYSGDPEQRADQVASEMRDYYEANRPLSTWERVFGKRPYPETCFTDDLMVGLRYIVLRSELEYLTQKDPEPENPQRNELLGLLESVLPYVEYAAARSLPNATHYAGVIDRLLWRPLAKKETI